MILNLHKIKRENGMHYIHASVPIDIEAFTEIAISLELKGTEIISGFTGCCKDLFGFKKIRNDNIKSLC